MFSVEANQGLKEGELIKAFMNSNIMKNYRFKGAVIRQNETVDFVTHLEHGAEDVGFRGRFSSYLRQIDRKMRDGFNGGFKMGFGDTYGRARRIPQPCRKMTEICAMIQVEHFSVCIGMANGDLFALLVMRRMVQKIMGIISRWVEIILITNGTVRKAK